jgi:dTDP-4-amino-4,6-dideoxygalactose transaminase
MDAIREVADRYGLIVIEDACQAHGAQYFSKKGNRWQKAGSIGLAGCFSFYPGKNLGACGEGGAVTTNDENIAQKVSMLRDHGQAKKYYHDFEGYNGRLDSIQCGILRIKLKHLANWNEKRRQNATLYNELLNTEVGGLRSEAKTSSNPSNPIDPINPTNSSNSQFITRNSQPATRNSIVVPFEPLWSKPVYHLYIVRAQKRDDLQKYLSEHGISTGLHYPIPLHVQNAYKNAGLSNGSFPVTEKVAREILSLPMFPGLSAEQIGYVVNKIKEYVSK